MFTISILLENSHEITITSKFLIAWHLYFDIFTVINSNYNPRKNNYKSVWLINLRKTIHYMKMLINWDDVNWMVRFAQQSNRLCLKIYFQLESLCIPYCIDDWLTQFSNFQLISIFHSLGLKSILITVFCQSSMCIRTTQSQIIAMTPRDSQLKPYAVFVHKTLCPNDFLSKQFINLPEWWNQSYLLDSKCGH